MSRHFNSLLPPLPHLDEPPTDDESGVFADMKRAAVVQPTVAGKLTPSTPLLGSVMGSRRGSTSGLRGLSANPSTERLPGLRVAASVMNISNPLSPKPLLKNMSLSNILPDHNRLLPSQGDTHSSHSALPTLGVPAVMEKKRSNEDVSVTVSSENSREASRTASPHPLQLIEEEPNTKKEAPRIKVTASPRPAIDSSIDTLLNTEGAVIVSEPSSPIRHATHPPHDPPSAAPLDGRHGLSHRAIVEIQQKVHGAAAAESSVSSDNNSSSADWHSGSATPHAAS
eukprot:gnl/Hemi2/15895_TR5255_c0_g1_i1.p1 gnl/Hemi2/15895_TR5255_c0_g1~~gnl/Hemi2/15895_TR5255_c0_g1_i1.p1  ORF type:complete len:283 (-),score=44.24 gnl/Hemi2/15895_TR5255_c0_g1_i1:141-989(-)